MIDEEQLINNKIGILRNHKTIMKIVFEYEKKANTIQIEIPAKKNIFGKIKTPAYTENFIEIDCGMFSNIPQYCSEKDSLFDKILESRILKKDNEYYFKSYLIIKYVDGGTETFHFNSNEALDIEFSKYKESLN